MSSTEPRLRTKLAARVLAAAILGILLLLPSSGPASVVPLTVEQMTAIADDIVAVRVAETKVKGWRNLLITESELEVLESFKGAARGRITVAQLGGSTPGGFAMVAPGEPVLKKGEEAILFLSSPVNRLPQELRGQVDMESPLVATPRIVGGFQGRLVLLADGTEERSGRQAVPGSARVTREVMERLSPGGAAAPTLEDFRAALSETVSAAQAVRSSGGMTKIAGVYGEFAVPARSASPALRALDPLPSMAYLSDAELEALNRQVWSEASGAPAEELPPLKPSKVDELRRGKAPSADPAAELAGQDNQ